MAKLSFRATTLCSLVISTHLLTLLGAVESFPLQQVQLLDGNPKYAQAARCFWKTVVENRSLVFGGNRRREHFPAADACMENHDQYGEFIFSHQGDDTLYVNLFIASELNWQTKDQGDSSTSGNHFP